MSSGPPVKRLKQSCLNFKSKQSSQQDKDDDTEASQEGPAIVDTQEPPDELPEQSHSLLAGPAEKVLGQMSREEIPREGRDHHALESEKPIEEPNLSDLSGKEKSDLPSKSNSILEGHSVPNHEPAKNIPPQELTSRKLYFQDIWYEQFHWLHFVPSLGAVVCFQCAMADFRGLLKLEKKSEPTFISNGFKNWKKAREKFKSHEGSLCHRMAVSNMLHWKKGPDVRVLAQSLQMKQQEQNRRCLLKIVRAVRFLLRQGLAHRGHEEEDGNFQQLLLTQAEGDEELTAWLKRDTNFTSHQCVEDMHQIFAHALLRDIISDINSSKIFSIVVDGTQDITGEEQESICIRFVDECLTVHEEFIGFHSMPETTGKAIAAMIFDVMLRLGISKDNLRGQTYDGAANMDGKFNGTQAIIREKCPLALHFRCAAHILHLVAERACAADVMIRDALDWLNELGKLYKQSGKYKSKFQHIATDQDHRSPATLKPLCLTRFLCRNKAISSALNQYPAILESLLEMGRSDKSHTAVRAIGLHEKAMSGRTYLGLSVASFIVEPLEQLNKMMQAKKQSISGVIECAELVMTTYQHLRTEESFSRIFHDSEANIAEYNLDPLQLPRIRAPPKRLTGPALSHQPENVESFFRKKFFAVVDTAMTQLRERFSRTSDNGLGIYEHLENILVKGEIDDDNLIDMYPELDREMLHIQLKMFSQNFKPTTMFDVRASLRGMTVEMRSLFPQVEQLLRLLLVCPVSSCEAERSFSALRRLKTWLRSTLTQRRLNWVAVCNVHKYRMDKLDTVSVAREFASMNRCRRNAFGTFQKESD